MPRSRYGTVPCVSRSSAAPALQSLALRPLSWIVTFTRRLLSLLMRSSLSILRSFVSCRCVEALLKAVQTRERFLPVSLWWVLQRRRLPIVVILLLGQRLCLFEDQIHSALGFLQRSVFCVHLVGVFGKINRHRTPS